GCTAPDGVAPRARGTCRRPVRGLARRVHGCAVGRARRGARLRHRGHACHLLRGAGTREPPLAYPLGGRVPRGRLGRSRAPPAGRLPARALAPRAVGTALPVRRERGPARAPEWGHPTLAPLGPAATRVVRGHARVLSSGDRGPGAPRGGAKGEWPSVGVVTDRLIPAAARGGGSAS